MRDTLRKLWADHVFWTRQAIVSIAHGLDDTDPVLSRLLRNQDELGMAIGRLYGSPVGRRMAQLLREHIDAATALISALRRRDQGKATAADRILRRNAEDMAQVLHSANPAWKVEDLAQMFYKHLDLLTAQAQARFGGDYGGDIAAFDAALSQAHGMADVMAAGR